MSNLKIVAMPSRPVVMVVLDGWGLGPTEGDAAKTNAIFQARTPNFDKLIAEHPNSKLAASGEAVGLPEGQMGNSDVGHANLGAGRVVVQDIARVTDASENSFSDIAAIENAIQHALTKNSVLHLKILLSDGGVHSLHDHLKGVLRLAKARGLDRVYIHAELDGRDTPPRSALQYVNDLENAMKEIGVGSEGTIGGRFYGMDRDQRWDRVEKAYKATVQGEGLSADSFVDAVNAGYNNGKDDEFILPTVINPEAIIKDDDAVVFMNFRADRVKEMLAALAQNDETFTGFDRGSRPKNMHIVTMVECGVSEGLEVSIHRVFEPIIVKNTLGEVISKAGLNQLRAAETEKVAHVTYFFNNDKKKQFENEDRILISSPKVATYDLQPEMSAQLITDAVLKKLEELSYAFTLINYANPDMVGHTGNLQATIDAIEAIDAELGRIWELVQQLGGILIVTADHGNAEQMLSVDGKKPHTAHTSNLVPIIIADSNVNALKDPLMDGRLADVAPTVLKLLGLEQPAEMTGQSLIVGDK